MTDAQSRLHDVLAQIHAQLDADHAEELAFFATDDLAIFSISVIAQVRSGRLVLSPEQLSFINQGLRTL